MANEGARTVSARIEDVVGRARATTGLDDFGGDTWREGLEALVGAALRESRLNAIGERSFFEALVRPLVNRLHVEDWYRRHPEIAEQELRVELLGVGFPRTGSTALSHLLAEDPAFRSLRIWEQDDPCPPPGVDAEADAERRARAHQRVTLGREYMAPRLRSMLPQSSTGPMEDHDLMALEFKAQSFLVFARIPSYADWFAHCDMEPTYRYEARVLRLLQWRTPEKVWRLKSPTHTMFLEAYEKVFPETRFVQTHRDVSKVLPSVSDLYETMLQVGSPDLDPYDAARFGLTDRALAERFGAYRQRFAALL